MKRLIFISGLTETLEYFSLQLARQSLCAGREVFLWDMGHPSDSIDAFESLDDPGNSVLITFNFIGISGEGQFGSGLSNIWDDFDIPKINIMVDSPVYYYRQLTAGIRNLTLGCIDRYHMEFVKQYYPQYPVFFTPLQGNRPLCRLWTKPGIVKDGDIAYFNFGTDDDFDSWRNRRIDALFIGNYVPLESLYAPIADLDKGYRDFIMDVASELISSPQKPLENTLMERLREEFEDCSEDEYLQACFHMIYVDLYVRNVYRGKIVTALADNGIKVYCTGKDWDKAPCKHPENLIHTGDSVVSLQCLQALSQAKISLNIMPWFKAGCHDRVFSSMLSGCALVSDSSEYMDEILKAGEHYARYTLGDPGETADRVAFITKALLEEETKTFEMMQRGKKISLNNHTWKAAFDVINMQIE